MSETIYIIGGGPSAGSFDTSLLPMDSLRIGVNDAALHKPCDIFFSNDHNYVLGIKASVLAFPGGNVHLSVFQRHHHLFAGWPVCLWRRMHLSAPTLEPNQLASGGHGTPGCSGYVALNLAAQLGARRIVLIGYDFHDSYTYFFDDRPFPRRDVPGVRASFRAVAPHYAQLGIEVLNASPGSAIDAFPIITHEAALCLPSMPSSSTTRARGTMITGGAARSRAVSKGAAGAFRYRMKPRSPRPTFS